MDAPFFTEQEFFSFRKRRDDALGVRASAYRVGVSSPERGSERLVQIARS